MRLLLCALLAFFVASSASAEIVLLVMFDDVSRAMAGYSNRSNDPDWQTGGAPITTPSLDAIADAGYVHQHMITSSVCTPSRARLLDYGPQGTPFHPYAGARTPDATPGEPEVEPNFYGLVQEAQAAGYNVYFTGKLHLGMYTFLSEGKTRMRNMGFNDADFVSIGNPTNELPGVDYDDTDLTLGDAWDDCKGHNLHAVSDISGNVTFTRMYSGAGTWDAADAKATELASRIAAGEKWLFIVMPAPPHSPNRPGDGVLNCNGSTEDRNDWPPGFSNPADGTTDTDVYEAAMKYQDTRLGEFITEHMNDDFTTHTAMVLTDNGTPTAITGVVPTCDDSPGKKLTPFVCGTTTFFAAAGPSIVAGKKTTSRLSSIDDIPATLLSLMGGYSVHSWGRNFADCMTESNGQTALSCRHTRDYVSWSEWSPIGSNTGTSFIPPKDGDSADTWDHRESGVRVWLEGGPHT